MLQLADNFLEILHEEDRFFKPGVPMEGDTVFMVDPEDGYKYPYVIEGFDLEKDEVIASFVYGDGSTDEYRWPLREIKEWAPTSSLYTGVNSSDFDDRLNEYWAEYPEHYGKYADRVREARGQVDSRLPGGSAHGYLDYLQERLSPAILEQLDAWIEEVRPLKLGGFGTPGGRAFEVVHRRVSTLRSHRQISAHEYEAIQRAMAKALAGEWDPSRFPSEHPLNKLAELAVEDKALEAQTDIGESVRKGGRLD